VVLRYNGYKESALRCSSIQGNGQAGADGLTTHSIASKAVRVNLRWQVSGRLLVCYSIGGVGALTWEYPWWSARAPWLIFLFGHLTFFLVSFWVFGMDSVKKKAIVVGTILGVDIVALILFMGILQWI